MDEEIGKYKKKTKSNTSKSNKKSKHKHSYIEVLLEEYCYDKYHSKHYKKPHYANMCEICGKINNVKIMDTVKTEQGYRVLDDNEVYLKYPDLPRVPVMDLFQDYVCVESEEEYDE